MHDNDSVDTTSAGSPVQQPRPRRILLTDDHPVVRRGIVELLQSELGPVTFGEAGSWAELKVKLAQGSWDLLILDLSLPDESGLNVLKEVCQIYPQLPVIVLTIYTEERYGLRAMQYGATSYICKQSATEELCQAVRMAMTGTKYVSPLLGEVLARDVTARNAGSIRALSRREREVLDLLASGKTITQIARQLSRSVKTVSTHRTRILEKLDLRTTAELIRYALEKDML